MNRERRLTGSNGYGRELGIDVVGMVTGQLRQGVEVFHWLDLCCGTGVALLECANVVGDRRLRITGVDLVDFFVSKPLHPNVELVTASVASWTPQLSFDLVTCVHGLHYVGDKLGVLARAASWLTADGLLVANLDIRTIVSTQGGASWPRRLTESLRSTGFDYDARQRRIRCTGRRQVRLPFRYLGADDQAGPNYTGQPAVNSYYSDTSAQPGR